MSFLNVIELLSGIALFLYGVKLMGDGLNKAAGNKFELVLYRLTGSPFKGLLLGAGVTALIQSSSAASVMVVGFVNAGMMKFIQAAYIILGSILGTSITGWITSLSMLGASGGLLDIFSSTAITGFFAIVGIYLCKFSKVQKHNFIGNILMGFAVLMYGMSAMSNAVVPLRESPAFLDAMTKFTNPALGIFIGMVFTCIIQSSAAAVGVLQAISLTGALSFSVAFPVMLGIAVGGAIPVLLSALGAEINGQRTALVHLLFDIFAALVCGVVFYAANALFNFGIMDSMLSPVSVALVNTLFRLVAVILLYPAVKLIAGLARIIVKDKAADSAVSHEFEKLEDRFVTHPALALEQSHIVIDSMANHVKSGLSDAISLLYDFNEEKFACVNENESLVDSYEDKLGAYLVKISASELTSNQNGLLYKFLNAITDFERISDHALNIAESAREIKDKNIEFSSEAIHEIDVMVSAISEIISMTISSFVNDDYELANHVEPLEELIDDLSDEMKSHHVSRLSRGICTLQHGFVFNDLVTNFERISDHCSNIALAILEIQDNNFDAHQRLDNLKLSHDENFERLYSEYKIKYSFN